MKFGLKTLALASTLVSSSVAFRGTTSIGEGRCTETCELNERDGAFSMSGTAVHKIGRDGECDERCTRTPRANFILGWECGYCTIEQTLELGESVTMTTNSTLGYLIESDNDGGLVSCTLSGGSRGDADLYMRYNELPTVSDYDCRSIETGRNEVCSLDDTAPIYVLVNSFSSFDGVTLRCISGVAPTLAPTPTPVPTAAPSLEDSAILLDETIANLADDEIETFDFAFPPDVPTITCNLACNEGDADLYVSFSGSATPDNFDCSSTNFECFESCSITTNGMAGSVSVSVYAFDDLVDVELQCGGSAASMS